MNTQFDEILAIIDRVAENDGKAATLFRDPHPVSFEDQHRFEEWSGKTIECIRQVVSVAYGKRQISWNPFADVGGSLSTVQGFSKLDMRSMPAISYSLEDTIYGQILIASTDVGICYLVFFNGAATKAQEVLQKEFPGSAIIREINAHQRDALAYLTGDPNREVHLHVKGTPDNLRVWEALTKVPYGKLIPYGTLAKATNHMAQDIGIAMGDNRIAILIPCHRVIKSTGELGQYHWGAKRKRAMIIKEAMPI